LTDPRAIRRISHDFGPGRPTFSPSQLESLAFCPFQFALRYVLKLEPADDHEELDDDSTARGSLIHRALERLHMLLRDEPHATIADRVASDIEQVIAAVLEEERVPASDVDEGLRLIESERLRRTGRRYAEQFGRYAGNDGAGAACESFEIGFGKAGDPYPGLVLGVEPEAVQFQGKIDRIDVLRDGDRTLFRVIDYKTGGCPSKLDIIQGRALQLPLYALAVERLELAGPGALPLDVGYWALKDRGYRRAQTMTDPRGGLREDWERYRVALEAFILALVARLRGANFPVEPRTVDCTRFCEYLHVCRIGQVRSIGKVSVDVPTLEIHP
jgi:ATP-dependent helicase/nuclease subunit B